MKKSTKICLIIAGICFAIGIIFCVSGAATGMNEIRNIYDKDTDSLHIGHYIINGDGVHYDDWYDGATDSSDGSTKNHSDQNSESLQGDTYTDSCEIETLKELDLDIKYGEIIFEETDGTQMKVRMEGRIDGINCASKEGGIYTIEDKREITGSLKNNTNTRIVISLPKDTQLEKIDLLANAGEVTINTQLQANTIDLEVDAGALTADDNLKAKTLKLNVGAGEIVIDEAQTDELDISCGVGSVEYNGSVEQKAQTDCGIGEIIMNLTGEAQAYNYALSCGVGEIKVGGKSYTSISGTQNIDNQSDRTLDLDCGVGTITVEFE